MKDFCVVDDNVRAGLRVRDNSPLSLPIYCAFHPGLAAVRQRVLPWD
jgi:hypothetical protein